MMGHDVRTAYDGPEALSIAAEYRPDAMFLDIGLPGMNGYEVARKVRELPELAGTTLVAFTGYCQDEDRRRLAEVGFEHHVVKPAGIGELAKILDALTPLRVAGSRCRAKARDGPGHPQSTVALAALLHLLDHELRRRRRFVRGRGAYSRAIRTSPRTRGSHARA